MTSQKLLQIIVGVILVGALTEHVFFPSASNLLAHNSKISIPSPSMVENLPTTSPEAEVAAAPVEEDAPSDIATYPHTTLSIGKFTVDAMVADNDKAWTQGLSGATTLSQGSGMWFIFKDDQVRQFWMPDMNFPIDIVWVDKDMIILGAAENAQPETNMENPSIFTSPAPARYVLEIPAGDYARMKMKPGVKISATLYKGEITR